MLSLWLHNPAMKEDILQTLRGYLSQINSLPHNIGRHGRIFHRSIHYPTPGSWKAVTDHSLKHWYQLSEFRKMTWEQTNWWQPSIKKGFWTTGEPQNNILFNCNGFIFSLGKTHTSPLFALRLITIVWSHKNPSPCLAFCCIPQLHSQIMHSFHKALIFSHPSDKEDSWNLSVNIYVLLSGSLRVVNEPCRAEYRVMLPWIMCLKCFHRETRQPAEQCQHTVLTLIFVHLHCN